MGRLLGMRQSLENITRNENRLKFLPMGTKEASVSAICFIQTFMVKFILKNVILKHLIINLN